MSRNYGLRNTERDFRRAEAEQEAHDHQRIDVDVARGWNRAGLTCMAIAAFGLLCLGWHLGWSP